MLGGEAPEQPFSLALVEVDVVGDDDDDHPAVEVPGDVS